MQIIKTLLVGAVVAAVGASAQVKKGDTVKAVTDYTDDKMMPSTTNAQTQVCSSLEFKSASSMMHAHDHADPKLAGHFKDPLDMFYPNIKWEPVHHSLWSFDDTSTDATNPLGFRQVAFKDNTPICLHMSADTARHKLELMIDFMAGSKVCVEDIRTSHMNPVVDLVRSCDDKGKVNRCFSALDGKYTSSVVITDPKETNFAEQPADFAVAIGCFDGGCRDDYAQSRLYYRVRQSEKTWTDDQGKAGEGLDYWCMSLAALSPNYGIFRKTDTYTFDESEINNVPQMYPSDMWTPEVRSSSGVYGSGDTTNYNASGSAASVTAGIATVALAVLSLMF